MTADLDEPCAKLARSCVFTHLPIAIVIVIVIAAAVLVKMVAATVAVVREVVTAAAVVVAVVVASAVVVLQVVTRYKCKTKAEDRRMRQNKSALRRASRQMCF